MKAVQMIGLKPYILEFQKDNTPPTSKIAAI